MTKPAEKTPITLNTQELIGVHREITGFFIPKSDFNHRFDFSGNLVIGTKSLMGNFTDIFGESDISGYPENNRLILKKIYTTNPHHINSESSLLYILNKTDKPDEYSGSYYYIHNESLPLEELVKFAKPKKNNDNIRYGGSCLTIIKNQISPKDIQELRNYMMTPLKVTDLKAYIDKKKRVNKKTLSNFIERKKQDAIIREIGF